VLVVLVVFVATSTAVLDAPAGGQTPSSSSEQPAMACSQWDVTGSWLVAEGSYSPIVTFAPHEPTVTDEDGIVLRGTVTLSEGEWQNAGWTGPSNSFEGNILGDKLTFLVTAPHRYAFVSVGKFEGTVTDGGVPDGTAKDLNALDRGTIRWAAQGPTRCVSFESSDKDAELSLLKQLGLERALDLYKTACGSRSGDCKDEQGAGRIGTEFTNAFCPHTAQKCNELGTAERRALPELVQFAACFAGAKDDGHALFPGVRAILPVLTRLAYHGATDKDPASAEAAASAAWRLFALVSGQDADFS
jgi:hypothetical protein